MNNDTYEGEYKVQYGQFMIVKQGNGVYTTDDLDEYNGKWDDDAYAEDKIHIRYNNNAEFRGNIDSKGTMNGPGIYMFPDGSSLEANWLNNKPFTNIIYRESLGFKWVLESLSENMISFSPGNHFWDDMVFIQDTAHSTHNESTGSI
ncbi:uncharacterized protein LOC116435052 isoform X3 [Nomia melanderi]|uniref:uncharacterized protein LOC116435052 isoform X3 n=2 Tax=Nomia melanderi TaxID=2448451 RepID=UPI0013047A79|nr:uncharacterized protein LOC116435052 isoform X2 [Nomia melanderi]